MLMLASGRGRFGSFAETYNDPQKLASLHLMLSICFVTAIDLDECQSPDACGANHTCNNTIGSYRCECPIGFAADSGEKDPPNPVCIGKKYRKLFYADTY